MKRHMIKSFLFLSVFICLQLSCSQRLENLEEIKVIDVAVRGMPFRGVWNDHDEIVLIISSEIGRLDTEPKPKPERFRMSKPSWEVVRDFNLKNQSIKSLDETLDIPRIYLLLPRSSFDEIVQTNGVGWDSFYRQYPNSPGYLALSRVGFNRKRDEALIAFDFYCPLCARCSLILLKKINRQWKWVEEYVRIVS